MLCGSAKHFERAVVMPNLKPPVTTTARAVEYREEILRALPPGSSFMPLMTLYLTDTTSPEEIKIASKDSPCHNRLFSCLLLCILHSSMSCVLHGCGARSSCVMPCLLCWIAGKSGVVFAVKLYPAGATTNSQDGVTDILGKCLPVLEEMVRQEMPLLVSSCCSSS